MSLKEELIEKISPILNYKRNNNIDDILLSVELIKNSRIEHEFRTTVFNIHELDDLISIAKLVSPSRYFLQDFKMNDKVFDKNLFSKDSKILEEYVITCNKYTQTNLRKK